MTDLSAFNDDELAAIMDTPRAVMEGAIVADGSTSAMKFLKELTAGAAVFKEAQRHENAFVKSVAVRLRERGSESSGQAMPDAAEAIAKALGGTERAIRLLDERADQADRDAYAAWLLRIATRVAEASRSKQGGFFSRKVDVSEGERAFIEQLTDTLAR